MKFSFSILLATIAIVVFSSSGDAVAAVSSPALRGLAAEAVSPVVVGEEIFQEVNDLMGETLNIDSQALIDLAWKRVNTPTGFVAADDTLQAALDSLIEVAQKHWPSVPVEESLKNLLESLPSLD